MNIMRRNGIKDIPPLQKVLANPTISTDELAEMVDITTFTIIGYADTANPNDGNRIYASIIWDPPIDKYYYYDDPNP